MTHTDSDFDHSYYLDRCIRREEFNACLPKVLKLLRELDERTGFDAIAFRGMSGALTAPVVAHLLDKELLLCRKKEEVNHSGKAVEGFKSSRSYVIVDDMISSGITVSRIQRMITNFAPHAVCLGTLEWNHSGYRDFSITPPEGWMVDPDTQYDMWGEPVEAYRLPPPLFIRSREPYYTIIPKEKNNAESNEQETAEGSEEAVFKAASLNASVYFSGLRLSTEHTGPLSRVKRETQRRKDAEGFRAFTDKLYSTPRNYLVQGR